MRISCKISLRKRVLPLKTLKKFMQPNPVVQISKKICERLLKWGEKVPCGILS